MWRGKSLRGEKLNGEEEIHTKRVFNQFFNFWNLKSEKNFIYIRHGFVANVS